MKVEFDKELKQQKIFATGDQLVHVMGRDTNEKGERIISRPEEEELHVATINDPVLVTDNYKFGQFNPVLRDTLYALNNARKRKTIYDNISLTFDDDKYKGVWGPSIDTLLMTRALSKINLKGIKKIIEIGAGSGFIAKYVINNSTDLEEITLNELKENAELCWKDNIQDSRTKFVIGEGIEYIQDKEYDLIICNPPYIDRPKRVNKNAYEGVEVIEELFKYVKKFPNTRLITNVSSLSGERIKNLLQDDNFVIKTIDQMDVPMKVYAVLNDDNWLEYLNKTCNLEKRYVKGHDYWQKIKIIEVKSALSK